MAPHNRLADETSPYLRQHADNPVDWFPWGDDAFAEARARDVPVLLSVGYSACHWCHVMAHESFEDEALASELNARFVPVKVDREERPDVDAVYMEAVQAMTGRGGWPMTVFLTPDGRPFFAGTYFPPTDRHGMPGFGRLLEAVDDAWRQRRGEIEHQADALSDAVARRVTVPDELLRAEGPGDLSELLEPAVAELARRFDRQWGGFGPAPKFPQPALVELCLRRLRLTGDESSWAMADRTLSAMAAGGMYDHLGGGFCRYSTDETWTVPHFEKMLYDQAGLVRVFLHAWQANGRPEFLQVVEETIAYVLRDLRAPGGGLYSAEDADSEGEEGRFYLWTAEEIDEVLGPEQGAVARQWYGVDDGPNFEGRSILRRPVEGPLVRPAEVEHALGRLFEARSRRVRPGLDDKVLTEWNAMFCSSLAEAAAATGRGDWAEAACEVAEFLLAHLRDESGRWLRSWQGGRARHLAYAADHAWLVDCFTRLAELTGRQAWLEEAASVARTLLERFGDAERDARDTGAGGTGAGDTGAGGTGAGDGTAGPLWTTASDAEPLVVRPLELLDGALPSATSVAGAALVRLGALQGDQDLSASGARLLRGLAPVAGDHPLAAASAVCGLELLDQGVTEVVVTGDRPDLLEVVRRRHDPTVVLAWGEPAPSPLWAGRSDNLAYVCRDYVCAAPAARVEELVDRLDVELEAQRARYRAQVAQ